MNKRDRVISSGPFKGKKVTFAPTTGVDLLTEISEDFMTKIFGLELGEYLITDESSLHDFTGLDDAEKLFFNHPDPQHREFIRAGAARVVLAIRPSFEQEVVSLLDQGKLGTLPDGSRFQKVVDDVQEANSKYLEMTQAPPNDADETDNPRQPGILIGSWHDYTPTGALDIEVEMIAVNTNGLPPPIPHP